MALFVSAYSRVRVASERGKRDNPAERTAINVTNRVRSRVLYKLQAQEYYINYNYKSNLQEYIQSIVK